MATLFDLFLLSSRLNTYHSASLLNNNVYFIFHGKLFLYSICTYVVIFFAVRVVRVISSSFKRHQPAQPLPNILLFCCP